MREDEIKVEQPGDCLGHYSAECQECRECEIAKPCKRETEEVAKARHKSNPTHKSPAKPKENPGDKKQQKLF